MSTIASPRPSIASLATPSSSRRASFDTSQTTSPSRAQKTLPHQLQQQQPRRGNRAALRDYYGLKSNDSAPAVVQTEAAPAVESEMDREGFRAEEYLERVMEKERLEGLLTVEGGLVNGKLTFWQIRGLDGERKALVYDNYSKLIAATETIRKMRTNIDPLTPTTSTLPPALSHIAGTASTLATTLHERTPPSPFSPTLPRRSSLMISPTTTTANDNGGNSDGDARLRRRAQTRTVKWVLDAPRRVRQLVREGRREEAEKEWGAVSRVLEKWEGVEGVEDVRREGQNALRGG
ncbi:MAG: hypothetical protein M1840_001362 [Geoglossum simile]|nr:MAG: hypothetical protein M1840_001362 [Geoglossum simile]